MTQTLTLSSDDLPLLDLMPVGFYSWSLHAQFDWICAHTRLELLSGWAAALEALIDAEEEVNDAHACARGDHACPRLLAAVHQFKQRQAATFHICPYSPEYEMEMGRAVVLEAVRGRLASTILSGECQVA